MKDIIHVVVLRKLFFHHFILQLQHPPQHTIKNLPNKLSLLRLDQLVIDLLQLSEDLDVAHVKHGQALEEHYPVLFRARGLSRQFLGQQTAQLKVGICPQLVVCPTTMQTKS